MKAKSLYNLEVRLKSGDKIVTFVKDKEYPIIIKECKITIIYQIHPLKALKFDVDTFNANFEILEDA